MFIKLQLNINKIIKLLIFGNSFINIADGFLAPIFSIYIVKKIAPDQIQVVGFAIAIYWLVKSAIQIPLSKYLDKTEKENDDVLALVIGSLIFILVPLFYIFINNIYALYLVQIIQALGGALYTIPWYAAFIRHSDKRQTGFEWSLNSGALGIGIMFAGATSGLLAKYFGFNAVFIAMSLIYLIALPIFIKLYLLISRKHRDNPKNTVVIFPEQKI